jgi:choline monooxygenase
MRGMERTPRIDPDIRQADTLPARFYRDPETYALVRERVFARSWQLAADARALAERGHAAPLTLLEGCLDEPLVVTRDEAGADHCLSNVCTHRGNIVVEAAGPMRHLRCRYHGRRFGLDGAFAFMPEFDGVAGFPTARDDLRRLPLERWGPFLFTSIDPAIPFEEWLGPVRARLGDYPAERLLLDESSTREYSVRANWALYCDNYLEGFHIPYVHPGLAKALDVKSYSTELLPHASLQLGIAAPGDPTFDLPSSHPDAGRGVAAYYFWLFPNTMLNVYPWGISVNIVMPRGVDETRIAYLTYVSDPAKRGKGAGADLDKVEMEDEEVVESVQRGVRSRLYDHGRYSPSQEPAVHHFHRLLVQAIAPAGGGGA